LGVRIDPVGELLILPGVLVMTLLKRVIRRLRLRARKRTVALGFERFEDRVLLSTFVVNTKSDSGTGSLRQAILDANTSPPSSGTDDINFDIPGSGPFAISLATALPMIVQPVFINGTTQPGYNAAPVIEIEGNGSLGDGLILGPNSAGSTIAGLAIGGFSGGAGIHIESNDNVISGNFIGINAVGGNLANLFGILIDNAVDNTIGGTTAAAANVIGFSNSNTSSASGLEIEGTLATGNVVEGNLIGTNASGADLVNNFGVFINSGANNTIGGTGAGAANTIGLNVVGVNIAGTAATGNLVEGNLIGTNANGANLGNNLGVFINDGANNTIGGIGAGAANTIGFNVVGVNISGTATTGRNVVEGNFIGTTTAAGGGKLGNGSGIAIAGSNNTIGGTVAGAGNTIAYNTGDAVDVASGSGNAIRQDLIFGNGSAIILAAGANNNQQEPQIVAVASASGMTTIEYTVTGTAAGNYTVEFFASNSLGGPAAEYLETTEVNLTAADSQTSTQVLTIATGLLESQTVTATVTGPDNSTSEFAASATPINPLVVTNTNDTGAGSLRSAMMYASTHPRSVITFAIPGSSPFVIMPPSVLPTIAVPVTIDGTTESTFLGQLAVVQINGGGRPFDGLTLGPGADGSTITGLNIADFTGAGIRLQSNDDTITDNLIGTDPTGNAPGPGNLTGIAIGGSSNTIGGTAPGARNVISGNTSIGIEIDNSTGNLVQANLIGTNEQGNNAVNSPDATTGLPIGVNIVDSTANTIGGTATGAGNVISGNTVNIQFTDSGGNLVQGNLIGTNEGGNNAINSPDATTGLPIGVNIVDSTANTIGGTATGAGNVISGNTFDIQFTNSAGNLVQGNLIGTNEDGNSALSSPDLTTGFAVGVNIANSPENTIGGTANGARNVISGFGVGIYISQSLAVRNWIQGNFIGTDETGNVLSNEIGTGIYINGAAQNTVGGATAGAGNLILGYSRFGVYINGSNATGNVVQGNQIVQAAQVAPIATEELAGIAIADASLNTVGGSTSAAGNTISGAQQAGIYILGHGNSASQNVIAQNLLQGNSFGIVLFNATNNGRLLQLQTQNRFKQNGMNIRPVTAPLPPSGTSTGSTSSSARKPKDHVRRTKPRPVAVQIHRTVRDQAALRPGRGSVLKADREKSGELHDLALSNAKRTATAVRTPAIRRAIVPHGPLAHVTSARHLTHP
jgi:hypothetical protein